PATRTPPATQSAFHEGLESSRSASFRPPHKRPKAGRPKRCRTDDGPNQKRERSELHSENAGAVTARRAGASLLPFVALLLLVFVLLLALIKDRPCSSASSFRRCSSPESAS